MKILLIQSKVWKLFYSETTKLTLRSLFATLCRRNFHLWIVPDRMMTVDVAFQELTLRIETGNNVRKLGRMGGVVERSLSHDRHQKS